jgi:hypothetical protein
LQLDVVDRSHDEVADLAVKAFELSQTLRHQWLNADYSAKRRILEIILSQNYIYEQSLSYVGERIMPVAVWISGIRPWKCEHCDALYKVTIHRFPGREAGSHECDKCANLMRWNSTSQPPGIEHDMNDSRSHGGPSFCKWTTGLSNLFDFERSELTNAPARE